MYTSEFIYSIFSFRDSFNLKSCLSQAAREEFLVGVSIAWPVAQQG